MLSNCFQLQVLMLMELYVSGVGGSGMAQKGGVELVQPVKPPCAVSQDRSSLQHISHDIVAARRGHSSSSSVEGLGVVALQPNTDTKAPSGSPQTPTSLERQGGTMDDKMDDKMEDTSEVWGTAS